MIEIEQLTEKNKLFDKLVLQSINSDEYIIEDSVYYNNLYLESLKTELANRNLLKKFQKRELLEISPGKFKMCSVSSSSRLCFLYYAKKGFAFEEGLSTGVKGGNPQFDAFDNNKTYYECKCREIFDKHRAIISYSYKELLVKNFQLSSSITDYSKLTLKNFGINEECTIYELLFDFKQLICHLLGLAKNGGGILQYIFFTPNTSLINRNAWCKEIYDRLSEEINLIWNSQIIISMCSKNNIKLEKPKYVPVSNVEDFVLSNLK